MHDILIKNGTILDGTGKPGYRGDIAIEKDHISAIGTALGEAKMVIDANEQYVAPGFIDITNHSDVTAAIFQFPSLESMVRQGITTIIGGNCGMSLAPLLTPDTIHGIRKWAPTSAINVNWSSIAELLAEVVKRRPAINFGTMIGHGTLRRGLTKEESRPLSLEEVAQMKLLIQRGLREGALGFSTSLGAAHEIHASSEEIAEIAKVLRSEGGVYKTHLRQEGTSLISSVNEAIRVVNEAKVPVSISHLKAIGRQSWPLMRRAIDMIDRTLRGGGKIMYDISPYATTGSQLYTLLPPWVRDDGFSAMLSRLRDKNNRDKILDGLGSLTLHYDRLRISEAEDGVSPGRTLQELADRGGMDPRETFLQLLLANEGRVSIIGRTLHKKNIELGIRGAASVIATNGSAHDASIEPKTMLPHPRSFGTFPRFLHHYVAKEKLLSWEEAVIKTSSLAAEFFGIKNRGKILPHYAADIVIFSPDTIRDRATYDNPFLYPDGIRDVLVNGKVVLAAGALTGERPGQIIKKL